MATREGYIYVTYLKTHTVYLLHLLQSLKLLFSLQIYLAHPKQFQVVYQLHVNKINVFLLLFLSPFFFTLLLDDPFTVLVCEPPVAAAGPFPPNPAALVLLLVTGTLLPLDEGEGEEDRVMGLLLLVLLELVDFLLVADGFFEREEESERIEVAGLLIVARVGLIKGFDCSLSSSCKGCINGTLLMFLSVL